MKITASLILVLLSLPLSAEYILVKKQHADFVAIDYKNLSKDERARIDNIYRNIIMVFQWPMLSMHFPTLDKAIQEEILGALRSDKKFALLKIANKILHRNYGEQFELIFVPDTIFEMGALNVFAQQNIEGATKKMHVRGTEPKDSDKSQGFGEEDLRNASYGFESKADFVSTVFLPNLAKSLSDVNELAASPELRYAEFLKRSYGIHNERAEIIEFYFETNKFLLNKYKKLHDKSSVDEVIKDLLKNYILISHDFALAIPVFNKILESIMGHNEANLNQKYASALLNADHLGILLKTAHLQYDSAQNNHFMLFRGTDGLNLNIQQSVLDAPSRELKRDFEELFNNLISMRYQISKPDNLNQISQKPDDFTNVSLSYGNSLLSGSVYEIKPQTGARALDYAEKQKFCYILNLPMLSYLETPPTEQLFFVSPFSTLLSLFSWGEFFHSRSKISFFKPGSTWSQRVGGINQLIPDTKSINADIILQDLASNLGFLVLSHIPWPRLSGLITKSIARHSDILVPFYFSEDEKQKIKRTQANLGDFEYEALDFFRHHDQMNNALEDIKNKKIALGLSNNGIKDENYVYEKRSAICKKVLQQIIEDIRKHKTPKELQAVEIIVVKALQNIDASLGISKKNIKDYFENFMLLVTYDLEAALGVKKLDFAFNPFLLYRHYRNDSAPANPLSWDSYNAHADYHYDTNNIFYDLINDTDEIYTEIHENSATVLSFDDLRKRTKEHFLVIPKSKYISFSNFAEYAQEQEMLDFMRSIANIAESKNLEKTGYRVVSNNSITPGTRDNNDAYQEIPHFHMHVAGGECLGKMVAAENISYKISSIGDIPFGIGFTPDNLKNIIRQNIIAKKQEKIGTKLLTFIAYKIPDRKFDISNLVGFTILDEHNDFLFASFHDFAKKADQATIKILLSFVNNIAKSSGIFSTGYRIVSNTGADAWQFPEVFQIFMAGGGALGMTVSNVHGNEDRGRIADYEELDYQSHLHRPPLYKFYSNDFDPRVLEKMQRQNRAIFNSITNLKIFLETELKRIKYLFQSELASENALREKIAQKQLEIYEDKENVFLKISNEYDSYKKYIHIDWKIPEWDTNVAIKNNLKKIYDEFESLKETIKELSLLSYSSPQCTTIMSLLDQALSLDKIDTSSWLFLDLDGVITQGLDSLVLTESGLPERIKELQARGKIIIGLTDRPYWDNMDNSILSPNKDTFYLLEQLGIRFSNPGDLPAQLFREYRHRPRQNAQFKDGVIFCADNQQGKGELLGDYLQYLKINNIELPEKIEFVDDMRSNVLAVTTSMAGLRLPTQGYWYFP